MGKIEDFLSPKFINSRLHEHLKSLLKQYEEVFEGVDWEVGKKYEKELANKTIICQIFDNETCFKITIPENFYNYYQLVITPFSVSFNIHSFWDKGVADPPYHKFEMGFASQILSETDPEVACFYHANYGAGGCSDTNFTIIIYTLEGELRNYLNFDLLEVQTIRKGLAENGLEISDSSGVFGNKKSLSYGGDEALGNFYFSPKCKFKIRKKEINN